MDSARAAELRPKYDLLVCTDSLLGGLAGRRPTRDLVIIPVNSLVGWVPAGICIQFSNEDEHVVFK